MAPSFGRAVGSMMSRRDFSSSPSSSSSSSSSDYVGISGARRSQTILIVEDNELNMKLFHDLLESHGYKTLQTGDGLTALDMATRYMPDLILMDIQLPEISGLEVIRRLKQDSSLRKIPVIAVTAFAMKSDEDMIRKEGCVGYISKPISINGFLQVIDAQFV